jgi:serine/threonine protein kinase
MSQLTLIASGQSPIYRCAFNQRYYALKVRLREQGETTEDQILSLLHHPSIVHCYGKFEAPRFIRNLVPGASEILVFDYISGYPLRYLELNPGFSLAMATQIVTDLWNILLYLKSHRIIHRDIHPNNVLYTQNHHVVLIDFEHAILGSMDPNPDIRAVISIGDYLANWIKIGDGTILRRRLNELRGKKSLDKIWQLWQRSAIPVAAM